MMGWCRRRKTINSAPTFSFSLCLSLSLSSLFPSLSSSSFFSLLLLFDVDVEKQEV